MNDSHCRCGSLKPLAQCCEPFIHGLSNPETAEQLMRSRFTAFTLHEFQYLIDTHHPSKRQTTDLLELQSGSDKTTWFKLTIHRIKLGLANNDKGLVEFSAFFNENGQFFELRETSSFIKEAAQWLYLEGNSHIEHINLKIKRNEPCWCCSGKKFKHCHARIEINAIQA